MKRQAPWAACRHLGWAAQWLEYEAELRANLSRPALTVPVFEDAVCARLACLCVQNGRQASCGPLALLKLIAGGHSTVLIEQTCSSPCHGGAG